MKIMSNKNAFSEAGIDYDAICDIKNQLYYKVGHPGLGIKLEGFASDGVYNVVGLFDKEDRLLAATIVFDDDYKLGQEISLGHVGVDSGQLLITDPCYIVPR
jgi:hypothetical protein